MDTKDQKGFGVFEIIIGLVVISTIFLVLMDSFLMHGRLFRAGSTQSEMQYCKARIGEHFSKYIRSANAVVSSATINAEDYVTDRDTLILSIPSINPQNDVIEGSYDYLVFYRGASKDEEFYYYLKPDAQSSRNAIEKQLCSCMGSIDFSYNNNKPELSDTVLVEAVFSKTIGNAVQTLQFSGRYQINNNAAEE